MSDYVLVIDDHPASLKQIEKTFSDAEIAYRVEADTPTAFELVTADEPISIVLIRAESNGIDGLQLCRHLRNIRPDDLHILMIVSDERPELTTETLDAGANDIILEPFSRAELLTRCSRQCRRVTRKMQFSGETEVVATPDTVQQDCQPQTQLDITPATAGQEVIEQTTDDFGVGIEDDHSGVAQQQSERQTESQPTNEPAEPIAEVTNDAVVENGSVFRVHQADERFQAPATQPAASEQNHSELPQSDSKPAEIQQPVEVQQPEVVADAASPIPRPNIAVSQPAVDHTMQPAMEQLANNKPAGSIPDAPQQDQSPFNIIEPYFDAQSQRYVYPADVAGALETWNNDPNVIKVPLDTILTCPDCSAVPGFRFGCGECGSGSIEQEMLIHHFACACVASEREFRQDRNFVCPKCRIGGLVAGTDFEVTAGCFACADCFASVDQPELIGHCMMCSLRFPAHEATVMQLMAYQIPSKQPQVTHQHRPQFTSTRRQSIQRK